MLASKKETLKSQLTAETGDVLGQCPELRLVKVADSARDNWTYLTHSLPEGIELVDYFHAAQHLKVAFDAAYGEHTTKAGAQFQKYRHIVRDDQDGAEKVIRSLLHLHNKHPRRKQLKTELVYFRGHRHRMHYAATKAENLPIGSGIIGTACKTLADQHLKRSGI